MSEQGSMQDAEQVGIHEPRCNTYCTPSAHHLADGIGYPHLHRTDLSSQCGECRKSPADQNTKEALTAGDLTADHVGMVVLDVPDLGGWERNLLLRDIDRREDGLWLGFRWNDDPSPQNTKRGQYACGKRVDPATPVRLFPPAEGAPTTPTHPSDTDESETR